MNSSGGMFLGEDAKWSQTLWNSLVPGSYDLGSLVFLRLYELPYNLLMHSYFYLSYPESFSVVYKQRYSAETRPIRNIFLKAGTLCCQYQ